MKGLELILFISSILLLSACTSNAAKRQGQLHEHAQHSIATKRTWPAIQHSFEGVSSKISKVYDARLRQRPHLAMTLKLMLTIEPNGKVENVHIIKTTAHDRILESKVIDIISHMNFGPVRSQKKLILTYPIAFVPK